MECSQKHLLGTPSNDGYYDDEDLPRIDPTLIGGMGNAYPNHNSNFNLNGYVGQGQPITPPGGEMSNAYMNVGIPGMSAQLVYPISYQDFSNTGGNGNGNVNQEQGQISPQGAYAQYGNGEYAVDNRISTPESLDFNLFSPTINNVIKSEFGAAEEFFDMTGLSSSQESSSETSFRVPALNNFPGIYDFSVEPVEKSGKKCLIWKDANKIFCQNEVEIMFSLKVADFQKAPLKDFSLETMLVYSENQHIMEPIVRCNTDIEIERKKNNGTDPEIFKHVLRSSCPRADYRIKNNRRHYVSEPLEKPQPGETAILRNFRFMCLSSCKLGMNKRAACIVFYLMEKGKQVGRHCFKIKICKCPTRDAKKENEKKAAGGKTKRKSIASGSAELEGQSGEKTSKQIRLSLPCTSTGPRDSHGRSRAEKVEYSSQDTDEEVLSQESVGVGGGSLRGGEFRIVQDLRLIQAHRRNPDAATKQFAGLAWNHYKSFRKTVQYMRTHILKEDGNGDARGIELDEEPGFDPDADDGQLPASEEQGDDSSPVIPR